MSKLLGGMQFFLVDYDLSPEHHFPRALYQCWKTYLWITDQQVQGKEPMSEGEREESLK